MAPAKAQQPAAPSEQKPGDLPAKPATLSKLALGGEDQEPARDDARDAEHQAKRATIQDLSTHAAIAEVQIAEDVKAKLFDPNPFVSEQALVEVFNKFDVDESGELENGELGDILTMIGMPVGKDVLGAILAEIDKDESGCIDADEFVEFFRQIQSVEALSKVMEAAAAKKKTLSMISGVYLFMTLIAIFVMVIFSEDNSGDQAMKIGLYISIAAFAAGIFYIIFLPILIIKLRPREKWEQLKEWYRKRKEQDRWADRTRKETVQEVDAEDRFQLPAGTTGSYRSRIASAAPRSNLRAIADARGPVGGQTTLAISNRGGSKQSKRSKGSQESQLRKHSKATSETKEEESGLQVFEDDPNEIKPAYWPEQYDRCVEMQEQAEANRHVDRAAEVAEMLEGGVYSHHKAMPTTHVNMFHNKAKLPQPVLAPWGDQRRWKKPARKGSK